MIIGVVVMMMMKDCLLCKRFIKGLVIGLSLNLGSFYVLYNIKAIAAVLTVTVPVRINEKWSQHLIV